MDALSRLVDTFLVNALWQIALIAAAGVLCDLLLRRASARYRHGLWIALLAAAIALPVASVRPRTPESPANVGATTDASALLATGNSLALTSARRGAANSGHRWWKKIPIAKSHRMLPIPRSLARPALDLYLCFIVFMLTRLARAWTRTRRIRQAASAIDPLPAHVSEALERCRQALAHRNSRRLLESPLVLLSAQISGPVTVGVRRPAIILPASLIESTAHDDLTAALAHEMAHISRSDYLWNLVYELLILPVAFHPLVRLILRRIGDTRELACDELAAQVMTTSVYARSLVRMAHDMSRRAGAALAPNYTLGVFDANILEERVMKLMKPRASGRLARVSLFSAAVLILSVSLAAARFSIGVAQPSMAHRGTSDQALTSFAGTWTAKFQGKTYMLLKLQAQDRQLAGTISLGQVSLDGGGNVVGVIEQARNPRAISLAKAEGSKLYFKDDGDVTWTYEMAADDAGHARLRMLYDDGKALPPDPFNLVKETSSAGATAQATVRNVVYADTSHAVKGAVSGGIANGVAGGASGAVPGGVSGGAVSGVSDGVPGATSRVQGGEVPAKNQDETKTGSLSGIVVDMTGARIPNAEVRLVSRNNAFQQHVQSDDSGNFSFADVPAGHYTLEVSSPRMGGAFRSFEFVAEDQLFFPFVLYPGPLAQIVAVTAKAPSSLGDKAAKLGPRRIRVGGSVEDAKIIEAGQPAYPEAARSRGAQGVVVMEATISTEGTIKNLRVITSPDDDLTKAALDAVSKWRYEPTLLNGDPVEVVTTIDVNFALQN